jgi:AcrR family transcriptional regulator
MPFEAQLSEEQKEEIFILRAEGRSLREIGEAVGCSKDTVNFHIKKREKEKNAALLNEAVAGAANKIQKPDTVFDIMAGLEFCLQEVNKLLSMDLSGAPLRDKLAVRTELRQLIREARETLESIYNIRILNEFITQVSTVLEEQSPGARERIYAELERIAMASGIKGVFQLGAAGQAKSLRDGGDRESGPGTGTEPEPTEEN